MGVIYNPLLMLVYIAFLTDRVVSHDFVHNPVSHYDINNGYFDEPKRERCGSSGSCSSNNDDSDKEESSSSYNYILIFTYPDIPSDPNCKGSFGRVSFPLHKSIKPITEEEESDDPLDKKRKSCIDECSKRLEQSLSSLLSWAQDKMKMNTMTISVQNYNAETKKKRHSHFHREKSKSFIPHIVRHIHRFRPRKYRHKRSLHRDRELDKGFTFSKHKNILRVHVVNPEAQDDELDNTSSTPALFEASSGRMNDDTASVDGTEILRKVTDKSVEDIPVYELVPTQFANVKDNLNFPTEGDYSWVTKPNVEDEDLTEMPKPSKPPITHKASIKITTTEKITTISSTLKSTNATKQSKIHPSVFKLNEADNKKGGSSDSNTFTKKPLDEENTSAQQTNYDSNPKIIIQAFQIPSNQSVGSNSQTSNSDTSNNPSVNELLSLLEALKEQFLRSMLNPNPSSSSINDDSPDSVPTLQGVVEEMFTQIQDYDNKNNFIAVINGGNVSDLKNCSSDLVKTLHYINRNSNLSNTVIILTASCPAKEMNLPFLVSGPQINVFRRVRELSDIPLTIEMHIKHARANSGANGQKNPACDKEAAKSYSANARMINQLFESFPNDFGSRLANERQLAESLVAPFDHWYDELAPNVKDSESNERKVKRDITEETKTLDNGSSSYICACHQILALITFISFNFLFE